MLYSIVPFLAFLVTAVINYDIFLKIRDAGKIPAYKAYRIFLFVSAIFFLVDGLWGVFDHFNWVIANEIDTFAFFSSMAITLLLWTNFVVAYIHISEMANRRISDPNEVVALHQKVKVKVIGIDLPRQRINLSLKQTE